MGYTFSPLLVLKFVLFKLIYTFKAISFLLSIILIEFPRLYSVNTLFFHHWFHSWSKRFFFFNYKEILFLSFHSLSNFIILWLENVAFGGCVCVCVRINTSLSPHAWSVLMYVGSVHKNAYYGFVGYTVLFYSMMLFEKCILYILFSSSIDFRKR